MEQKLDVENQTLGNCSIAVTSQHSKHTDSTRESQLSMLTHKLLKLKAILEKSMEVKDHVIDQRDDRDKNDFENRRENDMK